MFRNKNAFRPQRPSLKRKRIVRDARFLEEVKADIAADSGKPMHEFLAEAKAKREQSKIGK